MTPLEHSDHILKAAPGETLLVVEPTSAVNMQDGGNINYGVGARLRVKHVTAGLLWCLDDEARTVSFDRASMVCLERQS